MDNCATDWLYRCIVEQTPDAIIFSDHEGLIRVWNAGAQALFGHEAQDVLGKSLDLIIPEKLRARHWEGYRKVMATGTSRYGKDLLAVPAVRKDGARISVEFSILPVRSASGDILGFAAVLRDATARWLKEKELKDRIAALEKTG